MEYALGARYHVAEAAAIAAARRDYNSRRDEQPKPAPAPPPHFDPKALMASIESRAIAALSGRFAVAWRATGKPLPRRQDLPPEAFFPVAKLRRLVEALGDEWGLLFVALSYRWLTKEHPDPERFHLRIVAAVAKLYLDGGERCPGPAGSPLAAAFVEAGLCKWDYDKQEWEGEGPDFALFWDFACLHQKPRTAKEDALFKEGLSQLHVWYGHAQTVCWMQSELPPGFAEEMEKLKLARSYEESGWCFVDAATSAGVKVGTRRLDLGKRTDLAMGICYGGPLSSPYPQFKLEGVCAARRPPPLLPGEVRRLLETEKKFTTGKEDVEVVDKLYRGFFDGVAGGATALDFRGLEWGPTEAQALAGVLPRFAALQSLDLSWNKLGAAGVAHLAGYLRISGSLTALGLCDNNFGPEGAKALGPVIAASASLTSADLSRNDFGSDGAKALAPVLAANASLTAIDVSYNRIDQPSARLILEAMKGKDMQSIGMADCNLDVEEAKILAEYMGVMASLTKLDLSYNSLGAEAAKALATGLRANASLTSLLMYDNGIGAEGAKALAPALAANASLTEAYFRGNNLGAEGEAAIREAVSGKGGFKLEL